MATPNQNLLYLIQKLEDAPRGVKGVTFKFTAREEGNIYRLASELQKQEYELDVTQTVERPAWSCSASVAYKPSSVSLNSLCLQMLDLAKRHRTVFKSWTISNHPPGEIDSKS